MGDKSELGYHEAGIMRFGGPLPAGRTACKPLHPVPIPAKVVSPTESPGTARDSAQGACPRKGL